MPVDYYPQKSESELLALLSSMQDKLSKGAIVSVSAAGVSTSRVAPSSAGSERDVLRVLYSLHKKNPDVYSNPYADKITRTLPNYTL